MSDSKQDIICIGGGVGGLVTTSVAAQLGLKVTLIEKTDALGGDCLHSGCVPSKSLIHAAKVAHTFKTAKQFGINSVEPEVDMGKVSDYIAENIARIQKHDDPDRFRSYGAEVIFGAASFKDPHTVIVNNKTLQAKRFVIATGSSAMIPPIPGLKEANYLTNETIFKLRTLPKHLVVLGAGVIGIEIAQCFARLGSQVTVIEMLDRILPMVDPEISQRLNSILEYENIHFHLSTKAVEVQQNANETTVQAQTLSRGTISITGDHLLVATGQVPNVDGLNLDAAAIEYSKQGISVDQRLRTSAKHIFAVGDVIANAYKFTHIAEYEAGIVIANAIFRAPKKVNYDLAPAVIFSDPEIAMAGMTEEKAKQAGIQFDVLKFEHKDNDRAKIEHETHGLTKLIVSKGKLIGATVIGPHAGETIAELVLAMQAKIKIKEISNAIHSYPTLAEANRRAVNSYFSKQLFSPKTKKLVKWINKLLP